MSTNLLAWVCCIVLFRVDTVHVFAFSKAQSTGRAAYSQANHKQLRTYRQRCSACKQANCRQLRNNMASKMSQLERGAGVPLQMTVRFGWRTGRSSHVNENCTRCLIQTLGHALPALPDKSAVYW